ncbi:class I SAM-dependent methyltransferase [Tardiphaga sp.]|uniref:class I SAM-dependent methyltransferase n=1 Tax=Tardiphaga sp. TaxID=1926292 RepID=UPI0025D09C7A|nr:class I SAM-dependent methyltransferase [Tardiphaga sp.]
MPLVDQSAVFRDGEGDAWFRRNAGALSATRPVDRTAEATLRAIDATDARSICEVGCSNGWRLAQLGERYPGLQLAGFDVSEAAIAEGSAAWPGLTLRSGTADAPPFDAPFDVVIVSFVLHWVGRAQLARSIAAIDGLVRDGGTLETYALEEEVVFTYSSGVLGPVEDDQDRAVCTVLHRNLKRSNI